MTADGGERLGETEHTVLHRGAQLQNPVGEQNAAGGRRLKSWKRTEEFAYLYTEKVVTIGAWAMMVVDKIEENTVFALKTPT